MITILLVLTAVGFDWTPIKQFKLMFETSRGTVEGEKDTVYLRPETCQGEYVNFLNVQER